MTDRHDDTALAVHIMRRPEGEGFHALVTNIDGHPLPHLGTLVSAEADDGDDDDDTGPLCVWSLTAEEVRVLAMDLDLPEDEERDAPADELDATSLLDDPRPQVAAMGRALMLAQKAKAKAVATIALLVQAIAIATSDEAA